MGLLGFSILMSSPPLTLTRHVDVVVAVVALILVVVLVFVDVVGLLSW